MPQASYPVVISYVRTTQETAERIAYWLKNNSIPSFIDASNLKPTDDWNSRINQALGACKLVLLLLTRECETSDYVKHEILLADGAGVPILAVRLEDYTPTQDPLVRACRLNFVDLFDKSTEQGYGELALQVRDILNKPKSPSDEPSQPLPGTAVDAIAKLVDKSFVDRVLRPAIQGDALDGDPPMGVDRPFTFKDRQGVPIGDLMVKRPSKELFTRSSGRLLISGDQKVGKTIFMLQIVRSLIPLNTDAEGTVSPVVLDLQTWVDPRRSPESQPPLSQWIKSRLRIDYGLSGKWADELIDNHKLIYCLDDGDRLFDELDESVYQKKLLHRFIEEIALLKDRSAGIILTGGPKIEQAFLESDLAFFVAKIDSWTKADLVEHLRESKKFPELSDFVESRSDVSERLLGNPYELQILTDVFHGDRSKSLKAIADSSGIEAMFEEAFKIHISLRFDRFRQSEHEAKTLDKSSRRPAPKKCVTKSDLLDYLPNVAQYLGSHGQGNIFRLDTLQPEELPPDLQASYWSWAASMIGTGIFLTAGISGFIAVIADWLLKGYPPSVAFYRGSLVLVGFACICTVAGVAYRTSRSFLLGFLIGIVFATGRAIEFGLSASPTGTAQPHDAVVRQAIVGFIIAPIVFGTAFWGRKDNPLYIVAIEDWVIDRSRVMLGLAIAASSAALFWVMFGYARGLSFGLIIGLFLWLLFGRAPRPAPIRLFPNQAIVYALQNAIRHAAVITVTAAVIFGVSYGLQYDSVREGLSNAIMASACTVFFFFFGGLSFTKNLALLHLLHRRRLLPGSAQALQLLKTAVGAGVMRQVGSGFAFSSEGAREYYARKAKPELAKIRWGMKR